MTNSTEAEAAAGRTRGWKKIAVVAAAAMLLMALAKVLPLTEYIERMLDALQNFGAMGLVILAVVYVFACVLMLPGSALTLGAGFLAATLWPDNIIMAVAMGTAAASAGSIAGATAAFLLGRTFMRGWVAGKISANAKFAALDEAIGKNGLKMVFLVRLSPAFPFNLLNYGLGATKVSLRDYVLASWIGMLPATIMYVYFGAAAAAAAAQAAGEAQGGAGKNLLLAAGLLATVVLVVMVTKIAKRALAGAVGETAEEQA